MGEQLVDRQAPGAKERDHARHVALGSGRADIGTLQGALLGDQRKRGESHALVRMGQAGGHGHAAAGGRGISKLERWNRARHLEGDIDAIAGHAPDFANRIVRARVHRLRRPEFGGESELFVREINGDSPQLGTKTSTTGSPASRSVTPSPPASTIPAASWPSAVGVGRGREPSITDRSEWHRPGAFICTRTSPRPGGLRSSSAISSGFDWAYGGGSPGWRRTAAWMRILQGLELKNARCWARSPDGANR